MIITPAGNFNYKTQKMSLDGQIIFFSMPTCCASEEQNPICLSCSGQQSASPDWVKALHVYYPSFPKLNIYPVSCSSLQQSCLLPDHWSLSRLNGSRIQPLPSGLISNLCCRLEFRHMPKKELAHRCFYCRSLPRSAEANFSYSLYYSWLEYADQS